LDGRADVRRLALRDVEVVAELAVPLHVAQQRLDGRGGE
jgi:hypothetical protein